MATHKYIYTVTKKNTDINIHTNKYKQRNTYYKNIKYE